MEKIIQSNEEQKTIEEDDFLSDYLGVTYRSKAYIASINYAGNDIIIGKFETPKGAAIAYDRFVLKHFGNDAKINDVFNVSPLGGVAETKN